MSQFSEKMALIFSAIGHAVIHMFTAFYFVIVLAMEPEWSLSYAELLSLWTLGAFLVGAVALPAGWLGDRWGNSKMMAVFFVGIGASAVFAGLSTSPTLMLLSLSGIGLFAAIYHPVGIPWLIANSALGSRGRLLAINGVFGSVGAGLAGLVAGGLSDWVGWRAAFIIPGIFVLLLGFVFTLFLHWGWVKDAVKQEHAQTHDLDKNGLMFVFILLLVCMVCGGLIYQSTQAALPKLFADRHDGLLGTGTFGVGLLVAAVYFVAGFGQLLGGYLADRYPLAKVYFSMLLIQIPLLFLVSTQFGLPMIVVCMLMVTFGVSALPAENMLLAHYAPARHHGLFFGLKFVLAFGIAPLAVALVAAIQARYADFYWLFIGLAIAALLAAGTAFLLPKHRQNKPQLAAD